MKKKEKEKKTCEVGGMVQAVKHLPSKCETLNSNQSITKEALCALGSWHSLSHFSAKRSSGCSPITWPLPLPHSLQKVLTPHTPPLKGALHHGKGFLQAIPSGISCLI
jgi:hypothetical protein